MKLACLACAILLSNCTFLMAAPESISLTDSVMGTEITVTVVANGESRELVNADLKRAVDEVRTLEAVMSNWRDDSEVSRLNRLRPGETFHASPQLAYVLRLGLSVSELTDGAFDMTVLPLVERWGFVKRHAAPVSFPVEKEISEIRQRVGWRLVTVDEQNNVGFTRQGIALDLGGIAKGYGVDLAFLLLKNKGYENILVQISGETRCIGLNAYGRPWRIGIRDPKDDSSEQYIAVVEANEVAISTSGDYENFFFHEGKRYSHVIDPSSGYPVRNNVCSATVIAGECALADALATGLMVLGSEKGIALAEKQPGVEALIAVRNADDTVSLFPSAGMKKYVKPPFGHSTVDKPHVE